MRCIHVFSGDEPQPVHGCLDHRWDTAPNHAPLRAKGPRTLTAVILASACLLLGLTACGTAERQQQSYQDIEAQLTVTID